MEDKIEKQHNVFHSYCIKPNIRFDAQQKDEEVLLVIRSHPISQIPWIINGFIFIMILIIVDIIFYKSLSFLQFIVINLLSLTLITSFFWRNFLGYFFNVGILTNLRLIDVDYHTVFYKDVSEAIYSKIEDVSAKSSGIFESFFDFGTVIIQTAGTNSNVQFESVPKPSQVANVISDLID